MISIKEIAALTGFSSSTVSRVLSNSKNFRVAESTKEKILKVAKENGYQFNEMRRDGVVHHFQKVAVLIHQSGDTEVTNPYYERMKAGISLKCHDERLTPIFYSTQQLGDEVIGEDFVGVISVGSVDPEIIYGWTTISDAIVYIGKSYDYRKYSSVEADLDLGTRDALDYFFENGHRNIELIVGDSTRIDANFNIISTLNQRTVTYRDVMQVNNNYHEDWIHKGKYSINSGYEVMTKRIKEGNLGSAFLIGNDLMAIGALKALQNANIRVPQNLSIISYDDSELVEFASVPLTTVHLPSKDMGKVSVSLLASRLTQETQIMKVLIPPKLVIRDSVANVKEM